MAEDSAPSSPISFKSPEENLLYHSRTGDYEVVVELLNLWNIENGINLNCKGNFYLFKLCKFHGKRNNYQNILKLFK